MTKTQTLNLEPKILLLNQSELLHSLFGSDKLGLRSSLRSFLPPYLFPFSFVVYQNGVLTQEN